VEQRQAVQQQLERIKPPEPGAPMEHHVEVGDPAPIILQVAQESQCDLIVMGSHGRTGLNRLLMGSVAEQVARKAPCPVLSVKTPQRPTPSPAKQPGAAAKGAEVATLSTAQGALR
jgi:nucleotide-binding universal stress UspA family protein